jgi:hypothetical protein
MGDVDGALEALNSAFGRLTPGQDGECERLFVVGVRGSRILAHAAKMGVRIE